jgi:hypothetical protein
VVVRRGHAFKSFELRPRYVDALLAVRMAAPLTDAARALLGPKSAAWSEGHSIPVSHYDNFHGTQPIH